MDLVNCPNCGAPLHGWKCPYCESEFPSLKPIEINYRVNPVRSQTIGARANIPLAFIDHAADQSDIISHAKRDLAVKMSEQLLHYAEFETWLDPITLTQVLGARVTVLEPGGENYYG